MSSNSVPRLLLESDPEVLELISKMKEIFNLPDQMINFSIHFSVKEPIRVKVEYYPTK